MLTSMYNSTPASKGRKRKSGDGGDEAAETQCLGEVDDIAAAIGGSHVMSNPVTDMPGDIGDMVKCVCVCVRACVRACVCV